MDSDRIEGKLKETEGEAQQAWGKIKEKAADLGEKAGNLWDDARDEVEGRDWTDAERESIERERAERV